MFRCTEPGCSEAYTRKHSLKHHIEAIHLKKSYPCDCCPAKFTAPYRVTVHKRSGACKGKAGPPSSGLTKCVRFAIASREKFGQVQAQTAISRPSLSVCIPERHGYVISTSLLGQMGSLGTATTADSLMASQYV